MLRRPNAQTLHLAYHFDFRPERNPYLPHLEAIPLSPFWATLATQPRGSLRIAVAPFYFESYDWDAPRWERESGQTVVPGYLTGLCMDQRWGEVPPDPRYRFRNAVHLSEAARPRAERCRLRRMAEAVHALARRQAAADRRRHRLVRAPAVRRRSAPPSTRMPR